MKRFTLLLAFLALGVGCIALAAIPKEKKVVKIEVSSVVDLSSVELSANDEAINVRFETYYIAEPSGEVISEFHPPTVIGQINNAYVTSFSSRQLMLTKLISCPILGD